MVLLAVVQRKEKKRMQSDYFHTICFRPLWLAFEMNSRNIKINKILKILQYDEPAVFGYPRSNILWRFWFYMLHCQKWWKCVVSWWHIYRECLWKWRWYWEVLMREITGISSLCKSLIFKSKWKSRLGWRGTWQVSCKYIYILKL